MFGEALMGGVFLWDHSVKRVDRVLSAVVACAAFFECLGVAECSVCVSRPVGLRNGWVLPGSSKFLRLFHAAVRAQFPIFFISLVLVDMCLRQRHACKVLRATSYVKL